MSYLDVYWKQTYTHKRLKTKYPSKVKKILIKWLQRKITKNQDNFAHTNMGFYEKNIKLKKINESKMYKDLPPKGWGGDTDLKPGVPPGDLPPRGAGGPRPGGG